MVDVVNINDVLDGHVVLDLQCLDRVYLNGYVPKLQVGGQIVTFLTEHLGTQSPHRRSQVNWRSVPRGGPQLRQNDWRPRAPSEHDGSLTLG